MGNEKFSKMIFADVYPFYVNKAERKGRSREEVDRIIQWLTGYSKADLKETINSKKDFRDFFDNAPKFNPNAKKITGMICGYRVEDIEDKLIQKVRYLDKLIDELAKGKPMEKILRQ
jgi:hypothetical protein